MQSRSHPLELPASLQKTWTTSFYDTNSNSLEKPKVSHLLKGHVKNSWNRGLCLKLSLLSQIPVALQRENKFNCMPSTSNSLGKMQRRHQYHPNVSRHCKYGIKPWLYSQINMKECLKLNSKERSEASESHHWKYIRCMTNAIVIHILLSVY